MTSEATVDPAGLRDLIADVLDVDPDAVTPDADFVADLGVDSLLALELAVAMERQYRVKIESADIVDIRCMRDAEALLNRKLSAA